MNENGIGHNSNNGGLSEIQLQALAYRHKGKYEAALKAKKETDAAFKNACKRAIADGVSVDDIKLLIRLNTPEGEAEFKAELERQIKVASWENADIGAQFSFLDQPDRTPLEDRARDEGKRSGMKGESLQSPYDGAAGQAFAEGWHDGQEALFSIQGLSEARAAAEAVAKDEAEKEAAPAEPKPRGRPKGSKNKKDGKTFSEKLADQNNAVDQTLRDQATEASASTH